jgi:acyl carrier protein
MTRVEALRWIANVFEESPEGITPDTARADIPAWDSLGVLTLMAGFDQQFSIILSDDEIKSMTKVSDILDILRKNGKLSD